MPESLITSIQPHYQMQQAMDLPRCFSYALRLAGPLLALGVNAPFFPPDLYEDGIDPETILAEGWHENRIAVFESVLNTATETDKVAFPEDIDSLETAIRRVVNDEVIVPMDVDRSDRFHDNFATLRRKARHLLAVGATGVRRPLPVGGQRQNRVPPAARPTDCPGLDGANSRVCRRDGGPHPHRAPGRRSSVGRRPRQFLRRDAQRA